MAMRRNAPKILCLAVERTWASLNYGLKERANDSMMSALAETFPSMCNLKSPAKIAVAKKNVARENWLVDFAQPRQLRAAHWNANPPDYVLWLQVASFALQPISTKTRLPSYSFLPK
jgi:hypothetical protein